MYLEWLRDQGRAENTIRGYQGDVRHFAAVAGDVEPEDFERLAARYLNARKSLDPSWRTYNRRLSGLRSYGQHLDLGFILQKHKPLKGPRLKAHPLPGGIEGVLDMIDRADNPIEKALIALCGLCGARVSEALAVTSGQLNLNEKTVRLGGKNGQWRDVPVWQTAMEFILPVATLASLQFGGFGDTRIVPRSDSWARGVVKRLADELEMPDDVASHWLRHAFGSEVYERTKDIRLTQELLGHSKVETTQIYTHVGMGAMRNAVQFDNKSEGR